MVQWDYEKTLKLAEKYRLPFVKSRLTKNINQAIKAAGSIGYPVVLKAFSSKIIHKTDVGAVRINIRDEGELKNAYEEIIRSVKKKAKGAKIEGIAVQRMELGNELIIGVKKDRQFGNVIMLGLGGIFVEVLKDVSFRVVPITKKDASEMIKELKSYSILAGARGKKGVNFDSLINLLLKISDMAEKEEDKIEELDLNPVLVNENTSIIVDMRVIG